MTGFFKEGQFRLLFLVPAVSIAYRYCPPPPPLPSILDVGFCAVPLCHMSDDFQSIGVVPLWPLIVHSLRTEEMGL